MKLHIDESVKPTAQLHRCIPFHMRTKVKNRQYKSGRLHVAPSDCCATPKSRKPYNMPPLLDGPWMEVSVDFKVLPNSEYLLVITDDYSRYPIFEIITSTAAKVVIPVIDKFFAQFGVPHILKSDNGSPFQSDDFAKFANYLGFKHRRITPYWPRANA